MKSVRIVLGALTLTAVAAMGACGNDDNDYSVSQNYDVECDAGDYTEHDSDCGFTDVNGVWNYYYWTTPGITTYSPNGWVPPAAYADEYKTKAPVKTVKPKSRVTKAPTVITPKRTPAKVTTVAPMKTIAPMRTVAPIKPYIAPVKPYTPPVIRRK